MIPIAFSVVMPVRTGAPWLRDALDSIAAQSVAPIEVVVVDDGSEDESVAIVKRWGESHLHRLSHDLPLRILRPSRAPVGVAEARNLGVRAARGSWIAFLDQDDIWVDTRLEEQAAFVAEHPAFTVVGCLPRVWFDDVEPVPCLEAWGEMIAGVAARTRGIVGLDDLVLGCPFCLSGVAAQRAALLETGLFDRECPAISDWLMWARLSARHPLALLPRELVTYRVHRANQLASITESPLGVTSGFLEMLSRLSAHLARDLGVSRDEAREQIDGLVRAAATTRQKDPRFRAARSVHAVRASRGGGVVSQGELT